MSSLAEAIASLANPTPKFQDPEDDVNTDSAIVQVKEINDERDIPYEASILRSRNAPLLEDVDPRYAGRKVSKKTLENIFQDDETNSEDEADIGPDEQESSDDDDDEISEECDEEDLEMFKKNFQSEDIANDEEKGEDLSDKEHDSDSSEKADDSGVSEEESENNMVQQFSNIDVTSEIEKGNAIKAQQELWNKLCECRIRLQKLLVIANKLPQPSSWRSMKAKGGEELTENLNKAHKGMKLLMNNWLDLQATLLKENPDINKLLNESKSEMEAGSDEEIPSDSDEEMEDTISPVDIERKVLKRKLNDEDICETLSKRHKSLIPYRNSVIQKWDEKTYLSTGRMTQKSFAAFDNSALKQIEQILQDKNRLIKRTQLKRSIYRVLGKPDALEENNGEDAHLQEPVSKQDMLLKDYDPEIFDDDDFYRQILKDVIESKSSSIDPAILRKQMEIQRIRNKMKRKVDTKASKGRKLRYDIHPKLVNFMAPVPLSTISDEAYDSLLKCIFGRNTV